MVIQCKIAVVGGGTNQDIYGYTYHSNQDIYGAIDG